MRKFLVFLAYLIYRVVGKPESRCKPSSTTGWEECRVGEAEKTFETDALKLSRAYTLNFTLNIFVKEIKKPNGDCYAADSISYLVLHLGIQVGDWLSFNLALKLYFCRKFIREHTY